VFQPPRNAILPNGAFAKLTVENHPPQNEYLDSIIYARKLLVTIGAD
jgi:hypothetical protein